MTRQAMRGRDIALRGVEALVAAIAGGRAPPRARHPGDQRAVQRMLLALALLARRRAEALRARGASPAHVSALLGRELNITPRTAAYLLGGLDTPDPLGAARPTRVRVLPVAPVTPPPRPVRVSAA